MTGVCALPIFNEKGIGISVHYIPVHMHSYYEKKYGFNPEDFPIAKQLSESVITLPLYPGMTEKQIEYVTSTINTLWKEYRN